MVINPLPGHGQATLAGDPLLQTTDDRSASITIRTARYRRPLSWASPSSAVVPCWSASKSKLLSGSAIDTHSPPPLVSGWALASMRTMWTLTLATES